MIRLKKCSKQQKPLEMDLLGNNIVSLEQLQAALVAQQPKQKRLFKRNFSKPRVDQTANA
ncbi:hypothetical protein [Gloeocapsopsis dulcis]|uniref:hypothetical protein n=1 Tax=Gloeocapsopsis dulcis TaxID=2859516 RepID=UPI00101AD4C8|nr:hypothetical protein [Gloeocapsopsis dulcis]WNN87358.1 hypothetical protein P0S91_13545 [Gloeocapsopsis dulcis]